MLCVKTPKFNFKWLSIYEVTLHISTGTLKTITSFSELTVFNCISVLNKPICEFQSETYWNKLSIFNTCQARKQGYLPYNWQNKCFKDNVMNWACITFMVRHLRQFKFSTHFYLRMFNCYRSHHPISSKFLMSYLG